MKLVLDGAAAFGRAADAAVLRDAPDPLLDCLVELARLHGRPVTRAVLAAGLPMGKAGLQPSLAVRAAGRAGLAGKLVREPLDRIDAVLLPAILLLHDAGACVLVGWEDEGRTARVLLPQTGAGAVTLSREELADRYIGMALFAHPRFRFDQRAPEARRPEERHWFWGAFRAQWPLYRDVIGIALLVNLFALALPVFTMNVYDRVVPNFAVETLWMLVLGLCLVLAMDYALRVMRGYFVDLAGTRIDVRLSAQIMERVLGMQLAARPASVGSYAATLRSFESVRDFVASATVVAIVDLPFALLFVGVLAWISWPLAFIPVLGFLAVLGYAWAVQERMHRLAETTYRASAMRNATLVEALTGLEAIKAHGAEGVMQARMEETSAFLARTSGELRLASSSVVSGVATLQQFVTIATVTAGVYLIHGGALTMGGLIACSMLGGRVLGPVGQLVGLLMQYQNARTALASLQQTMDREPERAADASYLHRPSIAGDIAFENVHFSYPGREQQALRGITLRVRAGEKVAVIGRVGSGKTTLQRLLLGLYQPTQGVVTVDGVDLRQLDPAQLRRSIGYVEQDATLFYGTLRDNIALAMPGVDDESVLEAAGLAGLAAMVNRHPQGVDMLIGERGESLSGGQRQSVAIARAMLLDPPILLLDEPTGAMDFSSEASFKERLRAFARDKTMLLVTHRNSLLDLCDRLVVIDDGCVVADGPREKVVADLQAGRIGRAG